MLQQVLVALRRARSIDSTSHAWWKELGDEHRVLISDVAVRIKMSEYLALTTYREAVDLFEGLIDAKDCLKMGAHIRDVLGQGLQLLNDRKSFTVTSAV